MLYAIRNKKTGKFYRNVNKYADWNMTNPKTYATVGYARNAMNNARGWRAQRDDLEIVELELNIVRVVE